MFISDERSTLETIDFIIRTGSTPTFLYFDLYLDAAHAVHYVYFLTKEPHFVGVVLLSSLNFVFKLRTISSE